MFQVPDHEPGCAQLWVDEPYPRVRMRSIANVYIPISIMWPESSPAASKPCLRQRRRERVTAHWMVTLA